MQSAPPSSAATIGSGIAGGRRPSHCAAAGSGICANEAATWVSVGPTVTVQPCTSEQAPVQPANCQPASGCAVSVTVAPSSNSAVQVPGHSMPRGTEVTIPDPFVEAVRNRFVEGEGDGGGGSGENVAVTARSASTEREQSPVPV